MEIIPVIDLKDGEVVHAQQGKRALYQPINTGLCSSSNIYKVIRAFLSLCDFNTLYIADLNAITLQGDHKHLINKVLSRFPEITFWIDTGYQQYDANLQRPGNYLPILGSESYQDEDCQEIAAFGSNFILSLDFSIYGALGAQKLFANQELWPENIIIMLLDRVGSNSGPDLNKLNDFCSRYPDKNFIAAGGIRNKQDLIDLKEIGIKQALVASALHSGDLSRADIHGLRQKNTPAS
ncbi:Phosphoribosylformimino-5-aminoimidazole carboxamide ribotide isomerase [Candidatus Methylobacter favarea]|uniref:Phosphoribosylformimino-5-aminoimidazole carboxamide ribotide isomerase n=1 Tax=Candidatus Methylobacter favarea TaxID=2707345 RepID=A0A8S0WB54_9GAMM|nr:HisA/HisF-related TIM barrel protein [Candidatus Methylobacter favarea]CAA9891421.1 Phosphoribosylformimino-5-aminoimidazole carboxamide ribotide isomerase [Candidatus Methylobacter favarea]